MREVMDFSWTSQIIKFLFHVVLVPTDTAELAIYYLIWISGFLAINVVWDIKSPVTGAFHITMMNKKITVAHHGATLCSSLLLIVSTVSPHVWELAKESYVPVILAGLGGILTSIVAICPYSMAEHKAYKDRCERFAVEAAGVQEAVGTA